MMSSITAFLILLGAAMLAKAELEAPALVIRPPSYTIGVQNEQVHMTCVAYGMPLPKITWTRNDSAPIDASISESNITINGTVFAVSILEICAADMESHSAWYNCTASNTVVGSGIAEPTAQFYLHIMEAETEAPSIVTHSPNTTNVAGGTVEFVCIAYGNPLPEVKWYASRNNIEFTTGVTDETITVSGKVFRKSTLKLQNVNANMWITCNSSNTVMDNETDSQRNASFFLSVIEDPLSNPAMSKASNNTGLFAAIGAEAVLIILLILVIIVVVIVSRSKKKKAELYNTVENTTKRDDDDEAYEYTNMSDVQQNPCYKVHTFEKKPTEPQKKAPYEEVMYQEMGDVTQVGDMTNTIYESLPDELEQI